MESFATLPGDILFEILSRLDLPSRLALSVTSAPLRASLSSNQNTLIKPHLFKFGEYSGWDFMDECARLGYLSLLELAEASGAALDSRLAEIAAQSNRLEILRFIWKKLSPQERDSVMMTVTRAAAGNANEKMIDFLNPSGPRLFISMAIEARRRCHYALAYDFKFRSRWHDDLSDFRDPYESPEGRIFKLARSFVQKPSLSAADRAKLERLGESNGWTPRFLVEIFHAACGVPNLEGIQFAFDRGFTLAMHRQYLETNRNSEYMFAFFLYDDKIHNSPAVYRFLFEKAANEPEIPYVLSHPNFFHPNSDTVRFLISKGAKFDRGHLRDFLFSDFSGPLQDFPRPSEGDLEEHFKTVQVLIGTLKRPTDASALEFVPCWATPAQCEWLFNHVEMTPNGSEPKGNKIKRKAQNPNRQLPSNGQGERESPESAYEVEFAVPSTLTSSLKVSSNSLYRYFASHFEASEEMVRYLIRANPETVRSPDILVEAFFLKNNLSILKLLLSKFPRFLEDVFARNSETNFISSRVCQLFLDISSRPKELFPNLLALEKCRLRVYNFIQCLKLTRLALGRVEMTILRKVKNSYFQRELSLLKGT